MEFEPELAVKLDTKCLFFPVTHRVLLSKWQETLETQGKRTRIMPSRTLHLGNPGFTGSACHLRRVCRNCIMAGQQWAVAFAGLGMYATCTSGRLVRLRAGVYNLVTMAQSGKKMLDYLRQT